MAVIEYKHGMHPGGFCGFRVARTIGDSKKYRQKYFSFRFYGEEAETLARALDERWAAEARKTLKLSRTQNICSSRPPPNPATIVRGFRAVIVIEKKFRGGEKRAYFVPGFSIKIPGRSAGSRLFRIQKWGYRDAFILAARQFAQYHHLTPDERLALIAKCPPPAVFTDYLLPLIQKQGYRYSCKKLKTVLGEG